MPRRRLRSDPNAAPAEMPLFRLEPPPAHFANKYFEKDFGLYGTYKGVCIGVCPNAHSHSGDDLFRVEYGRFGGEGTAFRARRTAETHTP